MGLSPLDYWRLSDDLSVVNAAILVVGGDPSKEEEVWSSSGSEWGQKRSYEGFEAAFTSIKSAILTNRLAATIAFPVGFGSGYRDLMVLLKGSESIFQNRGLNIYDHKAMVLLQSEPDWLRTTVETKDLRIWLSERGIFPPFFFPKGDPGSFENETHPRHSGKLACAVAAWKAVTQSAKNKSVKQTLADWVAANGVRFGLTGKDGTVPITAIEDIAKVVNWSPDGGAPKTGGEVTGTLPEDVATTPNNYDCWPVLHDKNGEPEDVLPF